MKLSYRSIDFGLDADLERIANWLSDGEIRRLTVPRRDGSPRPPTTAREVRNWRNESGNFRPRIEDFILLDGEPAGHPVGMMSLILDPPHRLSMDR